VNAQGNLCGYGLFCSNQEWRFEKGKKKKGAAEKWNNFNADTGNEGHAAGHMDVDRAEVGGNEEQ
jgi:hypothetical protein